MTDRVMVPAEAPLTVEEVARIIATVRGYDSTYDRQWAEEYHAENGPAAYRDEAQAILAAMGRANAMSKLAASDADLIDIEALP